VTTITNRGSWVRGTTVRTSADRITAYHVRAFVQAMDAAGVPDAAMITDHHAIDTRHFTGLSVRVEDHRPDDDESLAEPGAYRPCPACGAVLGRDETHWSLMPEPMGGYVCPVPVS
jgi:hypothetical protein